MFGSFTGVMLMHRVLGTNHCLQVNILFFLGIAAIFCVTSTIIINVPTGDLLAVKMVI